MELVGGIKRWGDVISLLLFSVVWASLQWDVLRGLVTEGPSVVDSPVDVAFLIMLLITLTTTLYVFKKQLMD